MLEPKLVVQSILRGEREELVGEIETGREVKIVRGKTILTIDAKEGEEIHIPEKSFANGMKSFVAFEYGGRNSLNDERGDAIIICDENGQPMEAFYIRGDSYCGKRCYFFVKENFCTILADRKSFDRVDIKILRIHLKSNGSFSWMSEDITSGREIFNAAVKAATIKTLCPMCTHPHYAKYKDSTHTILDINDLSGIKDYHQKKAFEVLERSINFV